MSPAPSPSPVLSFSPQFHLLGPFQTGTREATWGADPLEYYGGFHSLSPSPNATYPSSLTPNATVKWSTLPASLSFSSPKAVRADLLVRFPDVDWESLRGVYGWAALQYQAWARGSLIVAGDRERTVVLYTDFILEFWVDDQHYFGGDFYAYRKAPLVLHLQPGEHRVDVRIVRDVRVMGGGGEPTVEIALEVEASDGGLAVGDGRVVLPDVVDGRLVSSLGSVSVRNEKKEWMEVLSIESVNAGFTVGMRQNSPLRLAPGHIRPLAFDVAVSNAPPSVEMSLVITYRLRGSAEVLQIPLIRHVFQARKQREPQKITYLHPGGVVSYAILRPPSKKALDGVDPTTRLPVVLGLHGAGVETDSDQVRHAFDGAPDLRGWLLFPSGVTPWSGDDWHRWGFADIEAAVVAVPDWIKNADWQGPGIDPHRWLVTGHSNGGQGAWYALTHAPDKIIGAAPISGYSSIQAYVPYQFWHEADPRITAVIQSSLADYRHEILLENSCGIPIHQQHGGLDDNVPPSHSRRLSLLLSQAGCPSEYSELPSRGHYFGGVMTTPPLLEFYDRILEDGTVLEAEPLTVDFVVANPGSTGSKCGIVVDQLTSPASTGKIKAEYSADGKTWLLRTSNIHRLHFTSGPKFHWSRSGIAIDGNDVRLLEEVPLSGQWLVRLDTGSWKISYDRQWRRDQRRGRHLGGLSAILGTDGGFVISTPDEAVPLASQISRNLFQYFGADVAIDTTPEDPIQSGQGNRIILLLGRTTTVFSIVNQLGPISIDKGRGIVVRDARGRSTIYGLEEGLGAIYLRPNEAGTLDLVVWGVDLAGLQYAARMVPMLTGVGQPDFVVVNKECAWKGAAGVHALGYLDSFWNISDGSVVL